jgi:AraC-like DNA-binding protein
LLGVLVEGANRNLNKSQAALEKVAESTTTKYKARAILSLAAVSALKGDAESQLYYYIESIKAARNRDVSTIVEAQQGIAILKAREGYHVSALRYLEELFPLARYSEHLVYHDFLNSYAVELTRAERIGEACSITKVILASPFASAYPEWQETLADVRTKHKQRSIVTISRPIERQSETELEIPNNPINRARVRAVIDFMGANLHRRITLAELAKTVNLSTAYFACRFKAETGVAPGEYLIRLRMEKASRLLASTFLSIKQVMADVGFNSKSNFVHCFRKHFHVTPSEYRKRALTSAETHRPTQE